ncbi:lysophospholipase [Sphingomonas sp.]|uniref:alpha/beta hydrolase n=1 Tax=Sphingomonas sp. TaxID=28214 RepID=UPI003CC62EE3
MTAEPWAAPRGLQGYRWPAAAPRARLLLQHGFAEHAGRYVAHHNGLIPALTAAGFDVHAFDLTGHGRSPGPRGLVDIGAMAGALTAARAGPPASLPLFLFGHSLGGLVTALSVAREPEGLAGVVLSGPLLPFDASPLLRGFSRLLAAVAPRATVAKLGAPSGVSRIAAEVLAYVDDPLVCRVPVPARLGASALAAGREVKAAFGRWRAPTLVVHGAADSYTDPKGSEALVAGIAAADKELMLVPDGRHELLNDLPRDAVLAKVTGWLAAHLPA